MIGCFLHRWDWLIVRHTTDFLIVARPFLPREFLSIPSSGIFLNRDLICLMTIGYQPMCKHVKVGDSPLSRENMKCGAPRRHGTSRRRWRGETENSREALGKRHAPNLPTNSQNILRDSPTMKRNAFTIKQSVNDVFRIFGCTICSCGVADGGCVCGVCRLRKDVEVERENAPWTLSLANYRKRPSTTQSKMLVSI